MAFSIDDYTDVQQLARGGMGKVYLATQTSLGRKVVIKEMAAGLLTDECQVRRFENEAKAAGSLDHDNVVRVYDFGEDRESFYIAMEYIDGPDLEHLLERDDFVPEIGLIVALHALKGLNYAHEHGIIHRDVKPANIMVSKAGAVKVLDFGLAHASAQSMHLTATDAVIGTPHFMSPEQANGVEKKDARMDIWSAGVLLFRIISGRYPFTGTSAMNVLYQVLESEPADIGELAPCLPESLTRGITGALTKEPQKRPASLVPLIEALQDYFYDIGVRDTVEVIRRYLTDPEGASFSLAKLLVAYHMRKGKELYDGGQLLLSKAHVARAKRIDPRNTGIARTYKKLQKMEPGPTPHPPTVTGESIARTGQYERALRQSRRSWLVWAGLPLAAAALIGGAVLVFQRPRSAIDSATEARPAPAETLVTASRPIAQTPPERQIDTMQTDSVETAGAAAASTPRPAGPGAPQVASAAAAPSRRTATQPPRASPPPAPGLLKVRIDPPDASVHIDEKELSGEDLTRGTKLAPGRHVLTATAPGFEPHRQSLVTESGATQIISVALVPAERGTGQLHIHSYPWAKVYIDGEFKGNAPTARPLVLGEGSYTVELRREGFAPFKKNVRIEAGMTLREKVRLSKE